MSHIRAALCATLEQILYNSMTQATIALVRPVSLEAPQDDFMDSHGSLDGSIRTTVWSLERKFELRVSR